MRFKDFWIKNLVILAITLSLALSGYAAEKDNGQGIKSSKDVLNAAITQEAASYDLHKLSANANKMVCLGNVYETLVTLDSQSNAVPQLAERFWISDDSTEFIFYLRKGVKFHDDSIMDADAVVASMNRWLESFSNAGALAGDSKFEKIDGLTVKIKLPQAARTFVNVIAGAGQPAAIMSLASLENLDGRGFVQEYIGTGPYRFAEWAQDQYIKLERFDDYVPYGDPDKPIDGWSGYKHAYIKEIYYHYVPTAAAATRVAGLETGQYDVIWGLTDDNINRVESNENFVVKRVTEVGATIVFNKKEGICSDKYLRQAINAGIDAEALSRSVYGNLFILDSSYINHDQIWYSDAGKEFYNQKNIEKAKELLKKSNYKGEKLRILVNDDRIALVFQQQLAQIGVNSEILFYDNATVSQYRNDPSVYDVYFTSWIPHPIPPMKPYLAPTFAGWANDEKLQDYFNKFYAASSDEEAKKIWDEAQYYCWSEYVPVLFLCNVVEPRAWDASLQDVNTTTGLFFWNSYFK